VTGGAGYIGAHTCKALVAAGYLPITLDNLSTGHRHFVRWGPLVEGDIRDEALVSSVCREHKVLAAIHFAANALVGESVANPLLYYDNNVTGSLSLLAGLRCAGIKTLVFSSTCAIYGNPDKQPIDESTPPNP
jgi:UDP-arabinose 4-epimerase